MNEQIVNPIILSFKVAALATIFAFLVGTFMGKWMSRRSFPGKNIVETFFLLPIVLPPSVVGFLLMIVFGRNSIIGKGIEWLFHQPVMFTATACVIASTVVAFPLMYQSVKTGFESIDLRIEEASRVDGANEWQTFRFISFPLAKKAILSGIVLSFTRALGEFGATLMFAGNIPGKTQTIPTAIYVAMDTGNMTLAWTLVLIMILISLLLLTTVQTISREK
ncbi:molybdate ABC transporter permease subunit [Bacillus sp. FJAT-47783]|uniref:molybdate ABC transporter permease subunit n=1 Tax=Bacillus sp. FJAT-47783 TaxID=2922712 RepID=UPI001FABB1E1